MLKQAFITILSLALTAGVSEAADSGKPAPAFTARDINGKTHNLSDFKGKIVVLEAYNLDCPFVKNHYRSGAMQELQKAVTDKGGIWLVVNSNPEGSPSYRKPEDARKEWTDQKMNATAWIDDRSGELGRKFGMRSTPHMFVIDQNGVLAYQGAIDDNPATSGDPRSARNYVRLAVEKLQSGGRPEVAETKSYGCGVKYKR